MSADRQPPIFSRRFLVILHWNGLFLDQDFITGVALSDTFLLNTDCVAFESLTHTRVTFKLCPVVHGRSLYCYITDCHEGSSRRLLSRLVYRLQPFFSKLHYSFLQHQSTVSTSATLLLRSVAPNVHSDSHT